MEVVIIKYISLFIVGISTTFLYVYTLFYSLNENLIIFLVNFMIIVGIIFSLFEEFNLINRKVFSFKNINHKDILFVFIGGILAYILNIYMNQGAIIASSLVGILGFGFIPKYSIQLYTGAFVGMISPEVYHDFIHVLIVSIIAGILFALSKDTFNGFGGKLGAIAFSSWIIAYYIFDIKFLSNISETKIDFNLLIISFLGFFMTYFSSQIMKNNIVFSSAFVSLVGALILPKFLNYNSGDYSLLLMASTFAGMSSKEKVKGIYEVVLISIFLPILFIYGYSHFGGSGGKLGTIAFGSVLASYGIKRITVKIKNAHK